MQIDDKVRELHSEALKLLKSQNLKEALIVLEEVTDLAPDHVAAWTNLAGVKRYFGDFGGALSAISKALESEPRSFFALFLRASILEQLGQKNAAARAYEIALAVSPPASAQDSATVAGLQKAREFVADINQKKFAALQDCVHELGQHSNTVLQSRLQTLIGNLTGQRKPFVQEPLVFNYPHMPAIEFWDRTEFPWLEELESQTEAIQAEFTNILTQANAKFAPYMRYGKDVPLDQWAELNNNLAWTAYHLIERGQQVFENARNCPKTIAALEKIPQPVLKGRTPVALFSILKPHTHIPPHTGASNTRLLCHLPLIIPNNCQFRVGGTWREWKLGEAFIFDDTIEHEARNDSDQMRAIIIFDVENPRLNAEDYQAIQLVTEALDEFEGETRSTTSWG